MSKTVTTQSGQVLTLPETVTKAMKAEARETLLLALSAAFYTVSESQEHTEQQRTELLAVMEYEAQRIEKLFQYGTFGRW